ncbi:hypothetical protein PWT90_10661 [Aphanocladium album]|nr:hypothetical protein PWT90_10661 [Aphanocladium album]
MLSSCSADNITTNMTKLLILLTLVSTVIAGSSEAFNLADQQLTRITAMTSNLTDAISSWDGTDLQTSLSNIHLPSVSLVEFIGSSAGLLSQQQVTLDNTQAFKIGTPAQKLAYAVNASIATLIRRKDDFDAAKIGMIVIEDLRNLLTASRNFSQTLTSLVPKSLRPVAVNLAAQNIDSLQQGIDCFNGTASACIRTIVDPNRTLELAIRYNAMKPDGSPFV